MSASPNNLELMIVSTLTEFRQWLEGEGTVWRGKERDCINIFAHRFLFPRIGPGNAIEHYAQVGIEVGVPNPLGDSDRKSRPSVSRDLVIWDRPGAVAWDEHWKPVHSPKAILEWKTRRKTSKGPLFDAKDNQWLCRFCEKYPDCLGFTITVDFTASGARLQWQRCLANGASQLDAKRKR